MLLEHTCLRVPTSHKDVSNPPVQQTDGQLESGTIRAAPRDFLRADVDEAGRGAGDVCPHSFGGTGKKGQLDTCGCGQELLQLKLERPKPGKAAEAGEAKTSQLSPTNIHQNNFGASPTSSSNSGSYKGSDSSPAMRPSGRYSSLGDNYNVKPQNPEQHLTPLQPKDILIQHLKRKLQESESKLKERETEGLKAQLGRMKDEWLEQECIRVEVELACWEARKEVKDLKKINESLQKRLAEKIEKIQKYCLDRSSVNKRLKYLPATLTLAQNRAVLEAQVPKYTCEWEGKPSALSATVPTSLIPEDQALEKAADSGLSENTAHETDSFEESLTTTTSELSDPPPSPSAVKPEALENVADGKLISSQEKEKISTVMVKQSSHTDMMVADSLDVEQPVQNIDRTQHACPLSPLALGKESGEISVGSLGGSGVIVDLTPNDPNLAILLSPTVSPCRKVEHRVKENQFVKERDFPEPDEDEALGYVHTISQTGRKRPRHKSRLLSGLLAVAVGLAGSLRKRASSLHWLKGGTRHAPEQTAREPHVGCPCKQPVGSKQMPENHGILSKGSGHNSGFHAPRLS
ncbi:PREDICTED: syntabulin-like [Charadrius vociferus]|uniref:syntabulin-like n=1 Tax=Charadrius vociferus TaxID=50402 RepID=UPI0005214BDA|nr:PREDICTED: syntabulin-like [Charadrius vociferus]